MVDFLNSIFDVILLYVQFIFSLNIVPGVTMGSVFLVATLFWVITTAFWVRK